MKYIYITGILLISFISNINAQESMVDKLAKIMFETKISQVQEDIFSMAVIEDEDLKKEITTQMVKPTEELYKELASHLSSTFSESEINYLIDFYKSPVGKKLLKTSDKFTSVTTTSLQDWQFEIEELMMGSN